jgi:pyruvate-ferredoxin/flavodoxin oxidoreductase
MRCGTTCRAWCRRDHRQATQALRDRRLRRGQQDRHGRAHQHDHADLLLRHQRRAAARRGHRPIKESIKKTYGKRGEAWCARNYAAVDDTLANLFEVPVPATVTSTEEMPPACPRPRRLRAADVTAMMIAGDGDLLPVSALPVDGTYPTGTTQWEKRNIALEVPVWDPDVCIQCGKCVYVCPHAVIRSKLVEEATWPARRIQGFLVANSKWREFPDRKVHACRSRSKTAPAASSASRSARPRTSRRGAQGHQHGRTTAAARTGANWDFFRQLPETPHAIR